MQQEPKLLWKTRPLADPVRIIAFLIVMGGVVFGVVATITNISTFGVWAALLGLSQALLTYSFTILFAPGGRPNAIYLRAFKTDKAAAKLRAKLSAVLGPDYRLSGIRSPRERSSVFLRFLLPGLTALRYAGSKFMELEAGDDWLARLWKTYQTTRLVFIDVRETTPNVYLEIRMSLDTMGMERCVFIVDSDKTADAWRQAIAAIIGPRYDPAGFHLLNASDQKMESHLTEIVQQLPAGVPGETNRGGQFVLDNVSQDKLAKSRRASAGAAMSAVVALVLAAVAGWLPEPVELVVLLPASAGAVFLIPRAFCLGIVRVRQLARFGHRGAAGRAAAKLGIASLPYLVGLVLMTVAIPKFAKMRDAANEQSAIYSLRVINLAEMQYQSAYPDHGFACQLSQLGGTAGAPSAVGAQIIPPDLTAGTKAGYRFLLSCTQATVGGRTMQTAFVAVAVPDRSGKQGHRGFCIDETGAISVDPKGGSNCTMPLQ